MCSKEIILIKLCSDHLGDLFRICQDQNLREYLMEGMEMTSEDCQQLIISNDTFLSKNLIGLYMVKVDQKFIGFGGFRETYSKSDSIDFVYAIVGEYFGKGIGSVLAKKLIDIYDSSGTKKVLSAVVNSENLASRKILKKNNFILTGKASGELDHLEYYIRN